MHKKSEKKVYKLTKWQKTVAIAAQMEYSKSTKTIK